MTTMFATTPLTEVPFLITVLASLLLLPERPLAAGLCAAAAILLRSNGIALPITALALSLLAGRWGRRFRLPGCWTPQKSAWHWPAFLAPPLFAFAAWELWCAYVRVPAATDILSYYTDYLGFYRATFSLAAFPHRVWINADGLLTSITRLLLWSTTDAAAYRQLCWAVTIFVFAGWVKLFRCGHGVAVLFAAVFCVLLLIWNFPPDQRFVYPLLPFAAAGIAVQIQDLMTKVRAEWRAAKAGNRLAAAVLSGAVGMFVLAVALLDVVAYRDTFPQWIAAQRARAAAMRQAYSWIKHNTSPQARIAAYDDPLLYLYTGRQATSMAVMPALVYEGGDAAVAAYMRSNVRQWTSSGIDCVLTTPWDFSREFQQPARKAELSELTGIWVPANAGGGATAWTRAGAALASTSHF